MEKDEILAFDMLYTSPQIQMLKLAMPLVPHTYQAFLATYIKYQEFEYTTTFMKKMKQYNSKDNEDKNIDLNEVNQFLNNISSYISEEDQDKYSKMRNLIQSIMQFSQYRPFFEMMMQSQSSSENGSPNETNNSNDSNSKNANMDILKRFLSEDQLAMFEMFNSTL